MGELTADVVRLQNGGELRGTLRPGHSRDPQLSIETLSGATVVIDRDQVALSSVRRIEIEQYEVRARELPETVAAHWELAEWCRAQRLTTQRDEQLEQILTLDPDHAQARKALGYVQDRGDWMTREEQMASRGYYLHQGKWVTQQELDLLEKSDAERTAEKAWFSKIHVWVKWIEGSNERQRQEGAAQLQQITDPSAVAALTRQMAEHKAPAMRRLFVEILSKIPGPRSVKPLVARNLFDPVFEIREVAFAGLRPDQSAAAATAYLPALRSKENVVVNRAGAALGRLGDVRNVPALIEALVTKHTYDVQVPVNELPGATVGSNGTFYGDPRTIAQYLPPEVDLALRSGQLPFGVQINRPMDPRPRFRQVRVRVDQQNDAVLMALQSLTGQNFGYDERTWQLWWASEGTKLLSRS
ncbi:MAG: HEAT repeat domain-containing protein [Planctomycetaceae bacterium]